MMEQVIKHLEAYINELIASKQIHRASSISYTVNYKTNSRNSKDKDFCQKIDSPEYKLTVFVYPTADYNSLYFNTNSYTDPYKCLKDIKFRIKNELYLQNEIKSFNDKIDKVENFDEISFLEAELSDLLESEEYEKADLIKKKIQELKKKIKK